jgi:MFS family permease
LRTPTNQPTLWRHSDFRNLWASQTISQFGSQFSSLAIPFTAIMYLNATPTDLGLLRFTGTAAYPIFGLLVGVWIDRHRKRPTMIVSSLLRGFVLALIPIAAVLGLVIQLGLLFLYVAGFAVGFLQIFYDISYQSFLPHLVSQDQLVEGNSKLEASRATAQVAGPTLAGLVIGLVTAPIAVAADASSFFASALSLGRIRNREESEGPVRRTSVRLELLEGLSVVFRDVRLRAIAGSSGTYNFFASALFAIVLLYFSVPGPGGLNVSGSLAPVTVGTIFSVGSIGALVGVASASRLSKRLGVGPVMVGSMFVSGLGFFPLYFSGSLVASPLVTIDGFVINWWVLLIMVGEFIASMGLLVHDITQVSLRQAVVPIRLQGRMNATLRWIFWGTIPLGGLVGGLLGTYLGLRPAVGVSTLGIALAFLWLLPAEVRSLKRFPERQS